MASPERSPAFVSRPFEGSTTPPPLAGNPPALTRMASLGNIPQRDKSRPFDIVETYNRFLYEDPEITMPVAAIEALIELLVQSSADTVYEFLDLVKTQSDYLKSRIPNSISLSAGTDLFQRYMISSMKPTSTGDFETVRQHLLSNGRLFVSRAKAARERIAAYGRHFVRDGSVVLTHGGSRVVGTLLGKAAEASKTGGNVRFKVIYVMNEARSTESKAVVSLLRAKGVPVATISEGAVGYAMGKVDLVIVGAEGVVENGGIISRLGTYQIALLAKAAGKPFYVAAESHKFVRLYPLGQYDLGIDQQVIEFQTEDSKDLTYDERTFADRTPTDEYFGNMDPPKPNTAVDAVDFTPPALVSALITETGVLTPSAVSEELISVWY
ncbi:hypothetical protein VTL71DRAFT_13471 [Oculimacula yallundae]|uniref:Translation initiation factor eIF2B subunit alpha n=1 Tax=Oculimacula yallundae TaxID=86028 RepID=A0ABR4CKG4_9HELO